MPSLDLLSLEFWAKASDFWAKDSQSLNHLALIIAGVIGIPLLAIRTFAANKSAKAADAQARTAEQGHITDRFTAAVEQLGSDKMAVRLGAVYALERISKDSKRDHWTIMETLTAFVRERAPWPPRQAVINPFVELQSSSAVEESRPAEQADKEAEPASVEVRPATDIQAVLTVLGRRDETARKQDQAAYRWLDLTKTHLEGAHLVGAHLEGADLVGAHLEGAHLVGAHLERAHLGGAHLERAHLGGAHLEGADLGGAHLEGAILGKAHLEGAHLVGAHLEGADLVGAHLEGADLGGAHLEGAHLVGAHLEGAHLVGAHLERAHLVGAHLEGANLWEAHLERAHLVGAHLERAILWGAHLEGAHLWKAHLEGAHLVGAHLERAHLGGAVGLTQGQLDVAFGDDRTRLPDGLTRPAHWPKPTSDEQPDAPDNRE